MMKINTKYFLLLASLIFPTIGATQTLATCPVPRVSKVFASSTSPLLKDSAATQTTDPAAPSVVPWIDETFQSYANTAALKSSTLYEKFYGPIAIEDTLCKTVTHIFDPTVYMDSSSTVPCGKYFIGQNLKFPAAATQVWVELWVKFEIGFKPYRKIADTVLAGCERDKTPGTGYVFVMGRVNPAAGAFGATMGTLWPLSNTFNAGAPCHWTWPLGTVVSGDFAGRSWTKETDENYRHSCGYGILPSMYYYKVDTSPTFVNQYYSPGDPTLSNMFTNKLQPFDGNWHRWRIWMKAAGGVHPNTGGVGLWIDNEHMGTLPIQDVAADEIYGLALGRFMWQRPQKLQRMWWGRVRVWNTDPGWNLCQTFCM